MGELYKKDLKHSEETDFKQELIFNTKLKRVGSSKQAQNQLRQK